MHPCPPRPPLPRSPDVASSPPTHTGNPRCLTFDFVKSVAAGKTFTTNGRKVAYSIQRPSAYVATPPAPPTTTANTISMLDPNHHRAGRGRAQIPSCSPVRRRKRRTRCPRRIGPQRPGRFFRPRPRLISQRASLSPFHLGETDWLLYRRRQDPFRPDSFKSHAYIRGFNTCRQDNPRPPWSPL